MFDIAHGYLKRKDLAEKKFDVLIPSLDDSLSEKGLAKKFYIWPLWIISQVYLPSTLSRSKETVQN